jgi:hypothetical protein
LSFPLVGNRSEPLFGKEGKGEMFMKNGYIQKIPLSPPFSKWDNIMRDSGPSKMTAGKQAGMTNEDECYNDYKRRTL